MQPGFEHMLAPVLQELLVLVPDAPRFTIHPAGDALPHATPDGRAAIVGEGLFEVLRDDSDRSDRGTEVRRLEPGGAGLERRCRRSLSSPVTGADGQAVRNTIRCEA